MGIKKIITGFALLFLLGGGMAVAADYDKGQKAYDSGDFKTAIAVWTPLAEQGDADAQLILGFMYYHGEGVLENYKTAAKWSTLAAEQGNAQAQFFLAVMFLKGEGVLENHKTAYRWAKLAAAQKHADAQMVLGHLALLDWDTIHAYMWLSLAIYNGADKDEASESKDAIKELMTPTDVDMAQQMASRCLESNYTDCWMIDKHAEDNGALQQLAEVEQALDSLSVDEGTSTYSPDNTELTAAVNYIKDEITDKWVRPANALTGMVVELVIHLVPTGEVVDIEISYRDTTATDAFVASVVKAVRKVGRFDKLSQLNPVLFDANFRKFTLKFKPEDLRL
jgi:hypothetical protein